MRTTPQDLGAEVRSIHDGRSQLAMKLRQEVDASVAVEEDLKARRIRIGNLLVDARKTFPDDGEGFPKWVEEKTGLPYSTANDYMHSIGYVAPVGKLARQLRSDAGTSAKNDVSLKKRPNAKAPVRVDRSESQASGDGFESGPEYPEEQAWAPPSSDNVEDPLPPPPQPTFTEPSTRMTAERRVEIAETRDAAVRAVAAARAAVARWVEACTRGPEVELDRTAREVVYRDTADMQDRIDFVPLRQPADASTA